MVLIINMIDDPIPLVYSIYLDEGRKHYDSLVKNTQETSGGIDCVRARGQRSRSHIIFQHG